MPAPTDDERLYRLVHDVYVLMDIADRAVLESFSLSRLQYNALRLLIEEGEHQLVRLAKRLLVTRSTITRLTDQLAARGLVRREDDPADRRAQLAFVTEAGRALWEQAHAAHLATIHAALTPLGHDHAALEALLRDLRTSVHAHLVQQQLVQKEDADPAPTAV
jgi:DNA-binding MarR family transcriptional regulator